MQLDMHYYGTYALARAAGLKPEICKIIATCAQFVDDNAASSNIEFLDGGRIDSQATAHHVGSVSNIDAEDQRQVWVPFHFLPGNEGDTFSERLQCTMDSSIAREMVEHHLDFAKHDIGAHLLGVAAHVYADTFSHYGFSGVSSRRNKVINDSFIYEVDLDPDIRDYLEKKAKNFFVRYQREVGLIANMKSWIAETLSGALGHGAVATYPDRPYLKWSFEYEYPKKVRNHRDNPTTFLAACAALHAMFIEFGNRNKSLSDKDAIDFNKIENAVADIINFQGKKEDRVKQWLTAAKSGKISKTKYSIPSYNPETWLKSAAKLQNKENSQIALDADIYRFYQAASLHRNFVLRDLLPSHGLVVA